MVVLKGWQVFLTRTYGVATTAFSIISVLAIFFDADRFFTSTGCVWLFLIMVILLSCMISGIWILFFNRSATIKLNNKTIVLRYGDIFKGKDEIKVIGVNCCFDTIVDDQIIAKNTLHGQFINRHFSQNVEELNNIISKELASVPSIDVSAEKHKGKQRRYPVGTIVPVTIASGTTFYLLALTRMDQELRAHCDPEDYFKALCALIDYCDQHSNGRSVQIPLLGSGMLSRVEASKQEKLTAMLSVLALKSPMITSNISIIIGKRDKHSVSIDRYA